MSCFPENLQYWGLQWYLKMLHPVQLSLLWRHVGGLLGCAECHKLTPLLHTANIRTQSNEPLEYTRTRVWTMERGHTTQHSSANLQERSQEAPVLCPWPQDSRLLGVCSPYFLMGDLYKQTQKGAWFWHHFLEYTYNSQTEEKDENLISFIINTLLRVV